MIRVGVIGVSGYTGLELIKILIMHPHFAIQLVAVSNEQDNNKLLHALHPCLDGIEVLMHQTIELVDIAAIKTRCELLFLATPHQTSMQYVKALSDTPIKIVDLSADYRLKLSNYEQYYTQHTDVQNIANAVYGLPEFYRGDIAKSRLIANPGCYPTASLLGLLPFQEHIDVEHCVIIDAKSGLSGAGKSHSDTKHFAFINENMLVYNAFKHRHTPEITEQLHRFSKTNIKVHFVPTLVPITRGMQVNIYAYIKEEIDPITLLQQYYKDEPFVRIKSVPTALKNVCGTHFCDIYATYEEQLLFITVNIDNLLRGASSQAVVNANIVCGLEEDSGIPYIPYMP